MKKVLILALVVMLTATSAWAYQDAKHVKVAPNAKGDLLVFPVYFTANGGWQTKLTVINTSGVYSTVAKVVIHSHYYSQELLDFLLYLTPNDVWTGTLTNDGTNVSIQSTDDSSLSSNGLFTSASNPMNQVISQATCTAAKQTTVYATDSRDFGYIEVMESWYGDLAQGYYSTQKQTGENSAPPQVSKTFLKRVYDKFISSAGGSTCADCAPNGSGAANSGYVVGQNGIAPNYDNTANLLTGHFELQNALLSGYDAGMKATVFADWDNYTPLTTAAATGFASAGNVADNTLGELEATLAKQDLAMPYVNQGSNLTVHIMTFPTKASWQGSVSLDSSSYCRYKNAFSGSPFWFDPTSGLSNAFATQEYRCLPYSVVNYDLTEQASASGPYSGVVSSNALCEEVNILTSSSNGFGVSQPISIFTEGWSRYNFTKSSALRFPTNFANKWDLGVVVTVAGVSSSIYTGHSYYGAPVIPLTLYLANGSMTFMNAAYSDGGVYAETLTAGEPTGRLAATHNFDSTVPTTGLYPYGPYQWNLMLNTGNAVLYPAAPYYHASNAGAVAPSFICVVGGADICTWLNEYQYSNEIIESGIATVYP